MNKKFTLAQVANIAGGKILAGDESYELFGMAPIGSAKGHDLTVLATATDVHHLTPDVKAAICNQSLRGFLQGKVPQIVVVDDVFSAAEKLRTAFTRLVIS